MISRPYFRTGVGKLRTSEQNGENLVLFERHLQTAGIAKVFDVRRRLKPRVWLLINTPTNSGVQGMLYVTEATSTGPSSKAASRKRIASPTGDRGSPTQHPQKRDGTKTAHDRGGERLAAQSSCWWSRRKRIERISSGWKRR